MQTRPHRLRIRLLLVGILLAVLLPGCHRAFEDFDPDEKVEQPDLSRIFPEGANRARDSAGAPMGDPAAPRATRGAPPPGARGGAAETASGAAIRGTLRLAPELEGGVPAGAVLFLIARRGESGPPTAVKRIPAPSFPLAFEIGPGDRMMQGVPFDGPFRISARVDADGNAMTRMPGDLQGASDGAVAVGSEGLEILLDERL